jgi:hypothetical protein
VARAPQSVAVPPRAAGGGGVCAVAVGDAAELPQLLQGPLVAGDGPLVVQAVVSMAAPQTTATRTTRSASPPTPFTPRCSAMAPPRCW